MDNQVKKAIRVALLVLALLNVVLKGLGLPSIDLSDEALTNFVTYGWMIASALWCCWKNCSVTKPYLQADKVAEAIKNGANIIIEYRYGGERALDGDEIEHELREPDDAEV